MSLLPHVIRFRRRRKTESHQNPLPRLAWAVSLLISLALVGSVMAGSLLAVQLLTDLPALEEMQILFDAQQGSLSYPTELYDRSGSVRLASLEIPATKRQWIEMAGNSSPALQFNPQAPVTRLFRAWFDSFPRNPNTLRINDLMSLSLDSIPQRLAYDLLLWDEPPGWQKNLRAKILGHQLVQRYGYDQIMVWFLNSIQLGPLVYGVETASQIYFSKSAMNLNILEAAALVAIADRPAIHPLNAPEIVRQHSGEVLARALNQGLITPQELPLMDLTQLQFNPSLPSLDAPLPSYVEQALQQIEPYLPRTRLLRGGYKIITTLDTDLQFNAECLAKTQLSRISLSQTTDLPADCPSALLLPTSQFKSQERNGQLAVDLVVMDGNLNEILALVSLKQSPQDPLRFDPTPLSSHPAGTILSPFVYLAGFSRGIQPASLVWDIPLTEVETSLQNIDGKYHGPVRARIALANDYFTPVTTLFSQIGSETIQKIVQQIGLELDQPENSISPIWDVNSYLFSSKIKLIEIAQAYSIFANQGRLIGWRASSQPQGDTNFLLPSIVIRVEDRQGTIVMDEKGSHSSIQLRPVISDQLAYLMTHVLSDETARWQSMGHPNPFEIGRPAAAKIGRALHNNQYWAIGFTPQRLVGVWLGSTADTDSVPLSGATGIWHALIQYSSRDLPTLKWEPPAGIQTIKVCNPSGMLPDKDCPATVDEIFIQGNEPHQTDTLYQSFLINEQTGRLATVFTPVEFVKEKRFLLVPPEAQSWAVAEGLPLPPREYDVIQPSSRPSANAQITSPAMFAYVHGKVTIQGRANGEGFQYYRLQIGRGLYPREWFQVAEKNQPVREGILGVWATAGLEGLFTLQLQVVGKENRVETALLQLTVDNTLPQISILRPQAAQSFSASDYPTITFEFQPSDDFGIKQIDIYLDNKKLQTLVQPPYVFPWSTQTGKHRLKVVVIDLAGNQSEAEVSFQINP